MNAPRLSLRRHLLVGILVPVLGIVSLAAVLLYQSASRAATSAYDRTLLASAKAIGEQLRVTGEGPATKLVADLPYSALEAFEADNRSRMYYKVSGFSQETVSGFADLPAPRRVKPGDEQPYAALVHFYDDRFRDQPVRMAVLLQPVAGPDGHGMATIQVAETLELRRTMARDLLAQTLLQQLGLIAVIAAVVVLVVQRATRPVRDLSQTLQARNEEDLSPLPLGGAPRELQPILEATNAVMARLAHMLEHQKRFVRDASHQLRTPLAVLKAQVQSARRGDVPAPAALEEIDRTVEGATQLANQMLALAKVEQLRLQGDAPALEWDAIVREVALDLSALIGAAALDFTLEVEPAAEGATVRAHAWALRELTRNLLHNAIKFSPRGATLLLHLGDEAGFVTLTVSDQGPGLPPALRTRLFQPFAAAAAPDAVVQAASQTASEPPADAPARPGATAIAVPAGPPQAVRGSGLGLAICHEIVQSLGGTIDLVDRHDGGRIVGLEARVRLPRAAATAALPDPVPRQVAG